MYFVALLSLLSLFSFVKYSVANNIPKQDYGHGHGVQSARLGAVTSLSKVCSNIGVNLLRAGGNAADAVSLLYYNLSNATLRNII
jgi:gamma-glutamyltranspeptidase/glutathione hydrolase